MKKLGLKTAVMAFITTLMVCVLACGGGSKGIGSNPKIPSFAKSAPASADALAAALEADAEFSDIEAESFQGMSYVSAKRTVGGKVYEVVAMKYGNETEAAQYLSALRSSYDAALKTSESSLKKALAEEGITNFNWNDTGLSYTKDGYEYFWNVAGSWWFMQTPYEA